MAVTSSRLYCTSTGGQAQSRACCVQAHRIFQRSKNALSPLSDKIAYQKEKVSIFIDLSNTSRKSFMQKRTLPIAAPHQGIMVSVDVKAGDVVQSGQPVAVMEAMKMQFIVEASSDGVVRQIMVSEGDTVSTGQPLLFIEPVDAAGERVEQAKPVDLDVIRPDLQEALERHAVGLDEFRPEAVERRRRSGQRTVRENLADLCDAGSFIEYGALTLAGQRRRRAPEELIKLSPADGLVAGIGNINGTMFPDEQSSCMVLAYDYTVFAGTQGVMNHKKTDRLLRLAHQWKLPIVLFAEGGGGRPGDTDWSGVAGLDNTTFLNFSELNGLGPLVGVGFGGCFAGDASLLGCCDVIIATREPTIGMGGPPMIEGGRPGGLAPEEGCPIPPRVGTPGFLVGPEAEKTATVRHVSRMFVTPGSLSVPFFSVVLRKGYGLGAQAMTGGSFHASFFTVAWPSGEFGAMGLEGAVRLGYRKELEAISDPQERQTRFEAMVDASYRQGKAISMASYMEIVDAIDPMETRHWIIQC